MNDGLTDKMLTTLAASRPCEKASGDPDGDEFNDDCDDELLNQVLAAVEGTDTTSNLPVAQHKRHGGTALGLPLGPLFAWKGLAKPASHAALTEQQVRAIIDEAKRDDGGKRKRGPTDNVPGANSEGEVEERTKAVPRFLPFSFASSASSPSIAHLAVARQGMGSLRPPAAAGSASSSTKASSSSGGTTASCIETTSTSRPDSTKGLGTRFSSLDDDNDDEHYWSPCLNRRTIKKRAITTSSDVDELEETESLYDEAEESAPLAASKLPTHGPAGAPLPAAKQTSTGRAVVLPDAVQPHDGVQRERATTSATSDAPRANVILTASTLRLEVIEWAWMGKATGRRLRCRHCSKAPYCEPPPVGTRTRCQRCCDVHASGCNVGNYLLRGRRFDEYCTRRHQGRSPREAVLETFFRSGTELRVDAAMPDPPAMSSSKARGGGAKMHVKARSSSGGGAGLARPVSGGGSHDAVRPGAGSRARPTATAAKGSGSTSGRASSSSSRADKGVAVVVPIGSQRVGGVPLPPASQVRRDRESLSAIDEALLDLQSQVEGADGDVLRMFAYDGALHRISAARNIGLNLKYHGRRSA